MEEPKRESDKKSPVSDWPETRSIDDFIPYTRTIKELDDIKWEQSPITKVEIIYQALKYTLA